MNEDQVNRFLDIQLAQLTMLQGIFSCLQVMTVSSANSSGGRAGMYNFNDVKTLLTNAAAINRPK